MPSFQLLLNVAIIKGTRNTQILFVWNYFVYIKYYLQKFFSSLKIRKYIYIYTSLSDLEQTNFQNYDPKFDTYC